MKKTHNKTAFSNIFKGKFLGTGIALVLLSLVLILSLCACDAEEAGLQSRYDNAILLMESESYEEAISIFEALDGFGDSAEKIDACREAIRLNDYNNAVALMQSGEYEKAIVIFTRLDGYKDSNVLLMKCQTSINDNILQLAFDFIERNDYASAAELLESIKGYKDSSKLLSECKYYLDFSFVLNKTGDGYILTEYKGISAEVTIPAVYAEKPVVKIGDEAFDRVGGIVKITLPEGVKEIGLHAFSECTALKDIIIPHSVLSIGEKAFEGCGAIERITFIGSEDEWESVSKDDGLRESNAVIFAPLCTEDRHYLVIDEAVAPTCTENGFTEGIYCSVCGEVIKVRETVAALGHKTVEHAAKAPSCEEVGWWSYVTCTFCDYTTYSEIKAQGHVIITHSEKKPTCTEVGWNAYETCPKCDYTTYQEKPALEHDILKYDAKAATCTEIGWNAYEECSRCNYSTYFELPIDKDNHDKVTHAAQSPTCAEIGWEAYETCSKCDYTTYSELDRDPNNHSIVTHDAKAPTCVAVGWDAYETCSRCTYSTYVELKKLNHKTETVAAKAPTCTEIGWNEYEQCVNCGYSTRSDIAALKHDIKVTEGKKPTCIDIGWDEYETCTRCSYSTYKEIPATQKHVYDNEYTCTVCLDYADNGVEFTLVGEVYGVTDYTGSETKVVIPSTYQGIPVTFIGDSAFSGNDKLEFIVFTDNIQSVGENAFKGCTAITKVCYTGSEDEWVRVSVSNNGNAAIIGADISFNYDFADFAEEISFHIIDVGQGDAILITTPWGNVLIDSGDLGSTPRAALTAYLAKYNVTSFEYVIFTHPDADHIGSGDYVMQNYDVKTVIMPDCTKSTKVYERLISAIEASNADLVLIGTGTDCERVGYTIEIGELVGVVMGPTTSFGKNDSNNYSVVVRFDYGGTSALFTGDAESKSENAMLDMYKNGELDCDILKVGHHGSTTSTTNAFLAAVTPDIAVISCGEGNEYGHPHKETMNKLSGAGVETYRTDYHGDVVITTNGINITVSKEK